jgi:plasmid rolling circle replication initiator protein Rep
MSWTDYKTNTQIAKELKITPLLDKLLEYKRNWIQNINRMEKLLEYKRNWIQHVNRMPRNRLPRVMKHYSLTGRRNHGRPLKRLLDT